MSDDVVAIIPARSGSKRVQNKNMRLVGDKPLISWTIDAVIKSEIFTDVIISTDSSDIMSFCVSTGLKHQNLRPTHLATDFTPASEVISYHLKNIESGFACYLQPTSPLRTSDDIKKSFEIFRRNNNNALVSVVENNHPKEWIFSEHDNFDSYLRNITETRSQDYAKNYLLNGAIYWFKIEAFHEYNTHLISDNSQFYVMPRERSLDIDTEQDIILADRYLKK